MPKKEEEPDKDHNKPITKKLFKGFVADLETMETKNAKLSGEKSALYKLAEDNGAHKGALKLAISLHKMDEGTREAFLSHFDIYRDYLALDEYEQSSFDLDKSLDGDKK